MTRLMDLTQQLIAALGLDTTSAVYESLDELLRDAGLVQVTRHEFTLPIGRWGGKVGELTAADVRAGLARICEMHEARGGLRPGEGHELVARAVEEWATGEASFRFVVACGRRPPAK